MDFLLQRGNSIFLLRAQLLNVEILPAKVKTGFESLYIGTSTYTILYLSNCNMFLEH